MKVVIADRFSLKFIHQSDLALIEFRKISLDEAKEIVRKYPNVSIIEHGLNAKFIANQLNIEIHPQNLPYTLSYDDILLIPTIAPDEESIVSTVWFYVRKCKEVNYERYERSD